MPVFSEDKYSFIGDNDTTARLALKIRGITYLFNPIERCQMSIKEMLLFCCLTSRTYPQLEQKNLKIMMILPTQSITTNKADREFSLW